MTEESNTLGISVTSEFSKIIDRRSVKCVTYRMWTCSLWEQFNLIDNKVSVWCTHALQIMFSGIKINVESRARSIFLKLSRPFLSKYRLQSAHFIRQVEEPKFVNSWHLTEIVWEAWNELLRWNSSQGRFYQFSLLLTEITSEIQHQMSCTNHIIYELKQDI